jgi:hypothetical protein
MLSFLVGLEPPEPLPRPSLELVWMADKSEISNMDGYNVDRSTKGSNGAN